MNLGRSTGGAFYRVKRETTVYNAVPPREPSAVVRVGELWEWFIQNCCVLL